MGLIDWQQFAAIAWPLLVALALGWIVRQALLTLANRARSRSAERRPARIVEVIAMPAAVAVPLFFLSLAVAGTPLPDAWLAWSQHILALGGLLCLTWLAARAVRAVEDGILQRHPLAVADNLEARRIQTQARVIGRVAQVLVWLVGIAIALMTFPAIRQFGATLLASAGIIGLVAGIAAKPVFGNLIAGLQIALTQPIRLDDVVIVDGEWGRIEEITSAYVVVRVWDERRLVVPLQWFVENPFQNWTRTGSQLLGTAFLWLDYRTPMDAVRDELKRICTADERWDGRVCVAQVTETGQTTMQVRLLVSARNSGELFDLCCAAREEMIRFLHERHPEALPRMRADLEREADPPGPIRAGPPEATATRSPGAEDINETDVAIRSGRQNLEQDQRTRRGLE